MKNNIANIIQDIVNSLGKDFSMNTYCDGWLIEILYKTRKMLIYGYNFPNNDATAVKLCNDKSACSEFLKKYAIPNVEHYLIDDYEQQKNLKELCDKIGYPIILKDNNGTCGQNVFRVMNFSRVMHNAKLLWKKNKMVSVCSEEKVSDEFRLIFYDGELVLCYKKMIPFVLGDGESRIVDLLENKGIDVKNQNVKFNLDYSKKISKGVKQNLTWKHNLCLGSSPFIIKNPDSEMVDIAQKAIFNIGIKFCSIDIFKLKNGKYKILEINGGVMMKYLSLCNFVKGYQLAFDIYKKAITDYFKV